MSREEIFLRAAQGYGELGMPDEGLAELAALAPSLQERADVLRMRLTLNMQARRWELALEDCRKLCLTDSQEAAHFIHGAFCLHELGRTAEAKAFLLSGPRGLSQEGTYHYNLACYEAVLGDAEGALVHLRTAFGIDKKLRALAKSDPDLRSIWNAL